MGNGCSSIEYQNEEEYYNGRVTYKNKKNGYGKLIDKRGEYIGYFKASLHEI